ncbi:MAG: alpha-1,4-glucan--maltose-1-phosphate maltosyltransferase [Spirochaetales bacterium]
MSVSRIDKEHVRTSSRQRTVIEAVTPSVNGGRFPAKHIVGEPVPVEANIFADGHDVVTAVVRYRSSTKRGATAWRESFLAPVGNDHFEGTFTADTIGTWEFRIQSWIDHFATLRYAIRKKSDANVESVLDQRELAGLLRSAAGRAHEGTPAAAGVPAKPDSQAAASLEQVAQLLDKHAGSEQAIEAALSAAIEQPWYTYGARTFATFTDTTFAVQVERERARFAAWYELFPRSTADEPGRHGTFADVEKRLSYVADLGFDILYLPPIHPIGRKNRKGPNNSLNPGEGDPGSPWAIGSSEGGHTAIHPELGTIDDFRRLVSGAKAQGLEIALDIAFQCAPDHPWVSEHPEWFNQRPDGSIQYAENPPKKYQDIYPLNFETEDWHGLWQALRDVFVYWMDQGVRIFRVDNPHTKAFPFWEWCISELRDRDPGVILLSEAFTRPNVKYRLGKLGFSLGYTYFTWRNTASVMREYVEELTSAPIKWHFRPSFWPNTPDILHETLQSGGRGAFIIRLVLASTLSSNYGVYGPAFELQEHTPREPGSEEYNHSEKYEIRTWDLKAPHSLSWLLKRMNAIRKDHASFARTDNIRFHDTDNPALLCYSKLEKSVDGRIIDLTLMVVNFDTENTQSGWVDVSSATLAGSEDIPLYLTDLLSGERYTWRDAWNFVMLDPRNLNAHVFSVTIPGAMN